MQTDAKLEHDWVYGRDYTPAWFTDARISWCIWSLLGLGVLARLTRYLLCFPLWEDEAFLAYNLIHRDFAGLLQPLDFNQIAPVGYLWLQRAVIGCLGFSEWTLRLPALVMGLASLLMFRRIALLTLAPFAQLFAVGLFAGAYPLIRYAAEAKQYGVDLFFSTLMLWMFLEWRAQPERRRWLVGLALLAPLAAFFSHAVVFTAGTLSLVLAGRLWRQPSPIGWTAWLGANVLFLSAFAGHAMLTMGLVHSDVGAFMHECWRYTFPPLTEPLRLPGWLFRTHTGELLAFPHGSGHGGSTLTLLGIVAGALLWRQRARWEMFALAFVPLALHFLAAALQRYPYGGHVKFTLHWVPSGMLLLGTGVAALCCWLDRHASLAPRRSWATLGLVALLSVGMMAFDFSQPAKCLSDLRARDFARWFWFEPPHEAVLTCLHTDLHQQFSADATTRLNWFASYVCNQRIYSPRHARAAAPDWKRVSAQAPLLVLEYRPAGLAYDDHARQRWLDDMAQRFELQNVERLPVTRYAKHERQLRCVDHIHVYKFTPHPVAAR